MMIEQFRLSTAQTLARYPYTLRAGIVGLGAGILFLIATLQSPESLKWLLTAAYIVVGLGAILLALRDRSNASDGLIQVALSGVTGFGLIFFTIYDAWWMMLVAMALIVATMTAQISVRRALLLAIGHAGAVFAVAVVRWGFLYPALTPEHITLGFGLLILGQPALIFLLAPAVPASSSQWEMQHPEGDSNQLAMQIRVTADGLARATHAINEVTTQQSSGAAEQAEAIGKTNDLLENFLGLSDQIREQARSVTLMAGHTAEFSDKGQTAIRQAIAGMTEIRTQVSAIAQTIIKLSQLTRRIDEIIVSVSEIATQSNLLALNASIEAARAGTQGRGFAVVADEVRSLSQQSTSAAKQVRAILGEIQSAMKETVEATQVGMEGVDAGVAMTQEADRVIELLSQNVSESYKAVKAIYGVIRQQMEDLEQIAISMERIERITQQNLTSTRMVETVSNNLTHLSSELQSVVEQDIQDAYQA